MLRSVRSGSSKLPAGTLVLGVLLAAGLPARAALLPAELASAPKVDSKPVQPPDPVLFAEYGFDEGEQATYGPVHVVAWRFRDSTGAMAAFEQVRPSDSRPVRTELDTLAAQTPRGELIVAHGNYLLQLSGKKLSEEQLATLYLGLVRWEKAPLPVISTYLPPEGLIKNSERYITGPVSLEKYMPEIPPSVAAFHLSAEAQFGRYQTQNGEMALAIFSYPLPNMAREQADAFRKIPGVMAKRTGALVAVVPKVTDPDAAERLLAKVQYEASVTLNEKPPGSDARSFAKSILEMILLSGIIILFCIISGALFAAVRIIARRGAKAEGEAMITLHIEGK
jgi:hypothetical protein